MYLKFRFNLWNNVVNQSFQRLNCGDVSLSLKESSFSTFPIEEIEEKKIFFYPGDFRFLIVQYINR